MSLDPEEKRAIANGEALYEIRETAGFKTLEVYLANLATAGAFSAINDEDEKHGVRYWRGYVDCAKQIVADVDAAIRDAQELKERLEADGRSFAGMRLGGGTIGGE